MTGKTYIESNQIKAVKRIVLLAVFITLSLFTISGNAMAQQDDKQHVLILNSYHQGFSWTNRVVAGISEAFTEVESTAEFHIEYMDTKRLLNEEYLQDIFQLLQGKYANIPVDVIILSDNNALEFMRTYGEQLFPGVPIVFTGINNFEDSLLEGFDQITGVAEATDIADTLSLMLRLHPETKQIYVINDQTATGQATLSAFDDVKADFEDQVAFIVYDDFKVNEMQQALATLPSDSLILMLLVNRDNTGQFFTYEESLDILSFYTQVPIYGVWDFYIEHGIVGGKLTDGLSQGRAAGEMALRILQGEAAVDIPILRESPNQYMFDYEQLERFEIEQSQLPTGSLIVNRDPTFYELYRDALWTVSAVFAILLIAIVVLLINIRQRQRAEESLNQSYLRRGRQVELSTQVTQDIVNITDLDALYKRVVKDVKEVFGYYHSQILQYDSDIDAVRLMKGYGEIGDQMQAQAHQMPLGVGLIGRAAATGETVLRATLADDPDWKPNPLLPDTKGEIAVPIKLGDEILGVLDVQTDVPDALSSEDQLLLEGLCGQIAIAIENARVNSDRQQLLTNTEIQSQRLARLNEMSAALNQADSLDGVYRIVGQFVQEAIDGVRASLGIIDPNGETFEILSLSGVKGAIPLGTHLPIKGTAVGSVIRDQRIKRFPHDGALESFPDTRKLAMEGIKTTISAPLYVSGQVVGALNIASTSPNAYGLRELSLMQQVANLVSSTLQVRKFLEETQKQSTRQMKLNEMSTALNQVDSTDDIYRIVGQFTYEVLRSARSSLAIVNDDLKTFAIMGLSGLEGVVPLGIQLPIEGTAVGLTILKQKVLRFPQDGALEKFLDTQKLIANGVQSTIGAPIIIRNQVFGALNIASSDANAYGTQDVAFMQQVANLVASALEVRQFIEATEKQAQDLRTVAAVSTTVAATLEQQALLQNVVDLTKERFGLYHAHIYLLDDSGESLSLYAGAGEIGQKMVAEGRTIPIGKEQSLVARAARSHHGVIVNDVTADPGFLAHPLLPNTCSEMAVPMIAGDTVLGVLDVQASEANHFTDEDVQIQTTLAAQTAIALQNARTIEKAETAVAQLNMLTKRLTREGWDQFLTTKEASQLSFGYDLKQVAQVSETATSTFESNAALNQPIRVQGEKIGALQIAEPQALSSEAQEIIASVTERLGEHIENLRLTAQTENALAHTEALFVGSERVVRSTNMDDILQALVNSTELQKMDRASILFFDKHWDKGPEMLTIAAYWTQESIEEVTPIGTTYPLDMFPTINSLSRDEITFVEDVSTDPQVDQKLRAFFKQAKINSYITIPLTLGDQWIGFVSGQSNRSMSINANAVRQMKGLTDQAAVVAQSLRLYEDAQSRAQHEQTLREVTERIHAAPDAESVLRIAAKEINRVFDMETFVYLDEQQLAEPVNGSGDH